MNLILCILYKLPAPREQAGSGSKSLIDIYVVKFLTRTKLKKKLDTSEGEKRHTIVIQLDTSGDTKKAYNM